MKIIKSPTRLGRLLVREQKKRRLKQVDLAVAVGVRQSTISRLLNGKDVCRSFLLNQKLAKFTGKTVEQIGKMVR